jgi:signal peptidase I
VKATAKSKTADKPKTNAQIIRSRRSNAETVRDGINLIVRLVVLILFAYIFFTQVFIITQAPGNDMFPAIKDGDLLIGYRLQKDFSKNDVVIYTHDGETKVGRILGKGTDIINIDEDGTLYINGTAQAGEILYPTYAKEEAVSYPYTVPEGSVFILGDYRTQSEDSRDFGAVSRDDVQAKVITLLRRRSL